jgi:small-conductance mechanosensitive channel
LRLLFVLLLLIATSSAGVAATPAAPTDKPAVKPARVVYDGREIVVLRATVLDLEPTERAAGVERRIEEVIANSGPGDLEIRDTREGKLLVVDGIRVVLLVPGDQVQKAGESLQQGAERVGRALQAVVLEGRTQRAPRALALAFLAALAATVALYIVISLLAFGRRRIETKVTADVYHYVENIKVGGITPFHSTTVAFFVRQMLAACFLLLACVAVYVWLEFCLRRFPQTRPVGEKLGGYLWDVFTQFGEGLVNGLPGLLTIVIIAIIARTAVLLLRMFFDSVARHKVELGWVDPYTAPITRRLLTVVIYVFAVAMAYPNIPGSDSAAFKGLTVLFGVMVSLGSSNVVGQAVSGLILVYSRSLKPGEFVRVADTQGKVTVIGFFATKIMVETGEELSIPNTVLVTTMTRNYSRTPEGVGGAIDTSVTLGYGTPWRQVHAMLIDAARRTEGVRDTPIPYVRQTELHDFYVKYMLCARIDEPTDRVRVLGLLHQNILDVFNEFGVQIMSPHYMYDPARAAVVPKEHWYQAPARPPVEPGGPSPS